MKGKGTVTERGSGGVEGWYGTEGERDGKDTGGDGCGGGGEGKRRWVWSDERKEEGRT